MGTPPTPISPASFNIYFRLDRIIDEYGSISTMPPVIAILRASPNDDFLFQQAMSNDYQRLQERSPDLEDHEINVFEAAFLVLMRNYRSHPGAMTLYVNEILGMKITSDHQKHQALKNAIHVRTLLLNLAVNSSSRQPSTNRSFVPTAQEASIGQQIFSSIHHPEPHTAFAKGSFSRHQQPRLPTFDGSADATSSGSMDDPRLTELLAVYREARSHLKGMEQNTETYCSLARILCSKATGCMQYMMKVKPGDPRLVDLRDTIERLSGGVGVEVQGVKRRRE